jgi:hypothetical protein
MNTTDRMMVKGWTEKALFDTYLYNKAQKAYKEGHWRVGNRLMQQARKKMFQQNAIWKLVKNLFDIDAKIPFITGYWTYNAIKGNLVTTRGKRIIAEQLGGVSTAPVTAIAIGIGTNAAAAGDTALQSESTTNGTARGAATVTNTTTTTTGDTCQWVKTFTLSGSFAITEEGLFDNNTSGGNMLARQVFSAINVVSTDTLQITHKVQFT